MILKFELDLENKKYAPYQIWEILYLTQNTESWPTL